MKKNEASEQSGLIFNDRISLSNLFYLLSEVELTSDQLRRVGEYLEEQGMRLDNE